jgi:hypothetical protein
MADVAEPRKLNGTGYSFARLSSSQAGTPRPDATFQKDAERYVELASLDGAEVAAVDAAVSARRS